MSYEDVLYEVDRQVATITIDRPEKLNAFRRHTLGELIDAFRAAAADANVGVIVLTGAGDRAFSAGGDVSEESEATMDGGADSFEALVKRLYAAVRDCGKPVIARVNGYAIGGGHHLAYITDLTIAADHAIFGQNGPRVASPAEGWFVSHLMHVIGYKRAKEVWMLCRRYPAQQALDWGLANAVVPMAELDAEVRRWCDEMLALSPTVLALVRRSIDEALTPAREHQDAQDLLAEINPGFFASGEQQEGAAAFAEKRPPDFTGFRLRMTV